jgi:hypothetical protein
MWQSFGGKTDPVGDHSSDLLVENSQRDARKAVAE